MHNDLITIEALEHYVVPVGTKWIVRGVAHAILRTPRYNLKVELQTMPRELHHPTVQEVETTLLDLLSSLFVIVEPYSTNTDEASFAAMMEGAIARWLDIGPKVLGGE